jgi:predicted ribosome quality control (RQC) complex YloA/Tae2 family protein
MNDDDSRKTDKIILHEILNLKDSINKIVNEVANIKAEIKIFENKYVESEKKRIEYRKKVDEILMVLESYKFQKLMIDADDLGDQETIINLCRKSYGYDKKYSGFDLFP